MSIGSLKVQTAVQLVDMASKCHSHFFEKIKKVTNGHLTVALRFIFLSLMFNQRVMGKVSSKMAQFIDYLFNFWNKQGAI